jgi:polyisoprenyl-phosphate glycosyltransferase
MKLTVIVSVYNEEEVLKEFWNQILSCLKNLNIDKEIIFINDGSNDDSLDVLRDLAYHSPFVKVISLSKNFGHESAMMAGIDAATGDAIVVMDADLQHPPQLLGKMLDEFLNGYEIITMARVDNLGVGILDKFFSRSFYILINLVSNGKLEPNASDFFLISSRVASILRSDYRERIRFLRGIIQTMGFKRTTIKFTSPKRYSGKSKYSFIKYLKLSIRAFVSLSSLPLHMGLLFGTIIGVMSILIGICFIICNIIGYALPSYTIIVILFGFLVAIQLFFIGIVGEYINFIFDELKSRPIYIVDEIISTQSQKVPKAEKMEINRYSNGECL